MNESILQALMRLFALVAYVNEKGQPSIERDVVQGYLQRQFSTELVDKYLISFDKFLAEYHPDLSTASDDLRQEQMYINAQAVGSLCNQLNTELEQQQKVLVMIYLLDFIGSGGHKSPYQFQFVEEVCRQLNISREEYLEAQYFTFGEHEKIKNKEDLLYADASRAPKDKKIKHLFVNKIEGRIVVLLVPSTNTLVFRYYGTQVLLLNGHNIKTNRSYIWAPGSVIKNPMLGSIYYTWVAGKFIKASIQSQFIFTANNIEFSYGNSPNGLKQFSLNEESGRLIGIIGGSGSGKSTLLKVLAGVIKPHKGSICINENDIHEQAEMVKGIIGYVPQEEFLIKELTVRENLMYNARFSFSNYSEAQIDSLVEKALLDFDLVEARDLRVGDALNTYLSGGQRKRLNIALELLREPSVLFVDEPTSGLSSSDSEKVINLLKRQTFKGKLVFANIHQPSSEIFKLLDKLLVVDQGGRVVWYGNPVDAIGYFKHINHYVDADSSECLCCGNINSDQILRNIEARVVDVNGRLTRKRKTTPQEWYEHYMQKVDPIIKNIKRRYSKELPPTNFSVPNRWQQVKLFFKRDVMSKLKNKQYLLVTLLEAPVLALLLAFYTRNARDIHGNITQYFFGLNNNIPAYIFMAVIVSLFLGLVLSAEEIYKDRKLMERERFLNLSRSSYLFSKTGVLFIISAFQMLMFTLIGNYILEIQGMSWRYFLILFTAAAWANLVGLNISSGFKSVVTIYILVPIILVPQLLFSGVVVDFHNLNKTIQSYKYVPIVGDFMTSRWAYEAMVVTQFRDNPFEREFFDAEQRISESIYSKAYLIPEIHKHIKELEGEMDKKNLEAIKNSSTELICNELRNMSFQVNIPELIPMSRNRREGLSREELKRVDSLLISLQKKYHHQYISSLTEKDKIFDSEINRLGGKDAFKMHKYKYYNNQLAAIVKNEKELIHFFEHNNNIIKLKDPIFTKPLAKNGRAHFYSPTKRIGNWHIDTFWFNITIIWLATFALFLVLYLDLLFLTIKYFENIRLRRFNRRIVKFTNKQNEGKVERGKKK